MDYAPGMSGKMLLVIDVQRGFVNEHTRHVVPVVERLQDAFERVIATRFVNAPGSPYRAFLDWGRFGEGSADGALAFRPAPHAVTVEKTVYSCVTDAFLDGLRESGTTEVSLCGIDTDACVLVTAIDLFQHGIRPVVLSGACASHAGPECHEAGLRLLERLVGKGQIIR